MREIGAVEVVRPAASMPRRRPSSVVVEAKTQMTGGATNGAVPAMTTAAALPQRRRAVAGLTTDSEMPGGEPIGADGTLSAMIPVPRRRRAVNSLGTIHPVPDDAPIGPGQPGAAGGGLVQCENRLVAAPADSFAGQVKCDLQSIPAGKGGDQIYGESRVVAVPAQPVAGPTLRESHVAAASNGGVQSATDCQRQADPANSIAGRGIVAFQVATAGGGEVQFPTDPPLDTDLAANVEELILLQRQRRFCIVSQSRSNRSVESFIARLIGYGNDLDAKERTALFKEAAAIRKEVEKGGGGQPANANRNGVALSAATPLILLTATSRESWDKHRLSVEKRMRHLARTLPVYSFVEAISGFGDLGLAIVIAETGNLSNYATKERVWKRLGLAVIEGERQQRRSDKELAAKHGYAPQRRAEIWTIADSLFKHQWAGAREDVAAHAKGPYGEVYAARKAHTEGREWTLAHRDADARRVMTKALIEALWKAWRAVYA